MMRVLVTGGAGFIGSHSVDALLESGSSAAVIDNLSTGRRDLVADAADFYELDIRSPELGNVFDDFGPTHVLHLAAQMDVRVSLERPLFDADVNVMGTLNVLEQCRTHGVNTIVFSSTGGAIYGEPETLPVTEDALPAPLCPYGASKSACEGYVSLYRRVHGIGATVLRYGNVYGPRQNPHGEAGVCAIFAGMMLEGKAPTLFGHGAPVRDYVHVSDVVRANLLALDRPAGRAMNISTGAGTSVRELYDAIQRLTGFQGEPVLAALRDGEVEKIFTSAERARETLGWASEVELEMGLAGTVDYIRARREQGHAF